MTGMEHAIEKAARIIDPDGWRLRDSGTLPLDHPGAHAVVRGSLETARALADAGLIAPAPLHVEQGFRDNEGKVWDWSDSLSGDLPVRRWATDWLPVDRAEGDGNA